MSDMKYFCIDGLQLLILCSIGKVEIIVALTLLVVINVCKH